MDHIYFDNGSTSFPKAPGVAEAVAGFLSGGAFNINRGNYEGAYELEDKVLGTREKLAALFHADSSKQVVFTPGITYSINFFLKGLLKPGDHVLTTAMEHNAVMRPLTQLAKKGITYTCIPAEEDGRVKTELAGELIRKETKAVIALHASNVCGTVVDIEELGKVCKKHGLFFAVDTAQTAGTLDIDMKKYGIDFLGFTGHKGLLGPQGIGGFLISKRLDQAMESLIAGGTGSQSNLLEQPDMLPDKYESGTMNLPGIVGLYAALSYLEETGIETILQKKMELTGYFLGQIRKLPDIRIAGRTGLEGRTAVVALDFLKMDNAVAAFELEQKFGIMTRVGLHCAPAAHKSLGTYPQGAVRFAFSSFNTKEEIDRCINGIRYILENNR